MHEALGASQLSVLCDRRLGLIFPVAACTQRSRLEAIMTTHTTVSHRRRTAAWAAVSLLVISVGGTSAAYAKEGQLRIAQQFGLPFLLLNVAQDQKLIEKHGKANGVDIKVEFRQFSGGSVVNDALLAKQVDIAGAGVGPLFTLWDRTKGKQNVKGVASLGNFPDQLVSINPAVQTIADFTDKDRIALPAVGVSVQSRLLQLAVAKQWGLKEFKRLDKYQVALPHPDAVAALAKGGTEINAHFSAAPYYQQELANNPDAHIVLSSYDIHGGPASSTVLYTSEKYKNESPKTYRAFIDALDEAAQFVRQHPDQAADIYLKANGGKQQDHQLILDVINDPQVEFTVQPQRTLSLGQFMHDTGAIKTAPTQLSDYFFDDPRVSGGS